MKKVFLATIFMGMMALGAQAQNYFAGSTLGFDYKANGGDNRGPATTSFELSPMVGYYLTDKLGAGIMLTLGNSATNNRSEHGESKYNTFEWGFAPFLRYTLLTRGDFSVLAQSSIGIHGSSEKGGSNIFGFGIDAMPILSYCLTNRVSLEVSSGLARFGFSVDSRKSGGHKSNETAFGFGVDSYNFFSSPYQVGMIYKFQYKKTGKSKQ
jgi:hypothetical protein